MESWYIMFFDNEESIIRQNEEDEKAAAKDMALYGYTECDTPFFDTKDYRKMRNTFINSEVISSRNYGLEPRQTKIIKENANILLLGHIGNINRMVPYMPNDDKVIYDFEAEYGKIDEDSIEQFIKYLKKYARKKDVTKIPITWITDDHRNGHTLELLRYVDELDLISKLPIINVGINLINQNDDLGSSVLVHEMTHALVDRHKGIIRNSMHDEVLSIYMELVAAYELDETGHLLNIALIDRLQNLKECILGMELNLFRGYVYSEGENYIDSSTFAFSLFEQYKNASTRARKALASEINKTFSGDIILEDNLEKLNITEQEGSEIISRYVKTLLK